jgi:hypothetical protein
MVNWTKDRNRRLAKRARSEIALAEIAKWSAGPGPKLPPPISKAALRAIGEELVRRYNKRSTGK